ncbi:TetR/AcrR family transcriptional regulator [Pseudactinotalea sp.]|uniref:TetR/AcrR family transcriptional regulator n=1 Tax=Pseudactinotalea sp. TaxID=1926260 RepID=UPI003B3B1007
MPRRPEQYERMRDATRESVQAAAVHLFARHGFAATTMRQIASAADISAGLIYRHYATKEALYDELLAQAVNGLAGLVVVLRSAEDPAETLRSVTAAILADLSSEGSADAFYLVMSQGFASDDPPGTAARLAREHAALWEATTELIRRGQQAGFPPGDPAELTTCYFATISGLVTLRAALGPALPVPAADILLRPILGDPS